MSRDGNSKSKPSNGGLNPHGCVCSLLVSHQPHHKGHVVQHIPAARTDAEVHARLLERLMQRRGTDDPCRRGASRHRRPRTAMEQNPGRY